MDFKNGLDYRTARLKKYEWTGANDYDFEKEGILTKCLPKILFKGNSILVTFLQLIDMRIIMVIKYVDRIKKFKWFSHFV